VAKQVSTPPTSDTHPPRSSPIFGLLAGISGLLLFGILFGASLWMLAGVAAALVVAAAWCTVTLWTGAATAVRCVLPAEVRVGTRLPVTVSLRNQGKWPILWLLVEDLVPRWSTASDPPTLQVAGQRVGVLMLWAGETKQLDYEIRLQRRGYVQVGPTVLETGDLMGLFRRYRVANEPQFVTVLPEVIPLGTYEIGSRRPIGEIRMRDNVMADPTRLRGIRRWQPGDPMRSVHWAATARTGVLHSKVYEPSSIVGATLVLDLHVQTNPAQHEPRRSDLAISTAASIANWLHESGEPFALATNGRDAADRVRMEGWRGDHRVRAEAQASASMQRESDRRRPVLLSPSRGPLQLKEMLRTLARLERTDALSLAELMLESESEISSETTLLVILQQATPESTAALIQLARRGWAVAVIVNTHDINDYSATAGAFIAGNIPTFHLQDADSIPQVCRQAAMR